MKYLAIIQARCGSSRLPNKVLKTFAGKPSILWTTDRAKASVHVENVVVATSAGSENDPLRTLMHKFDLNVFSGSEDDVLDRVYQAAKPYAPEYVVRITGDCPLYDPVLLDWAIDEMDSSTEYLSQGEPETFPDGLDIEILTFGALQRTWKEAKLQSEREHVTLYIRNNPDLFRIQVISCPLGDLGDERWTLDEEADYQFLKAIYDHFEAIGIDYPSTTEVREFLDENPALRHLNAGIVRNEGLAKSLAYEINRRER